MQKRQFLLALASGLLLTSQISPAFARGPAGAPPVAIDTERLATISDVLNDEIESGARAGFVAGAITRDGKSYAYAAGMADRENKIPMREDTRFRLASMTKPIVTAAVMQLVDRGVVSLNDPVSRFIPAYQDARVATSLEPGKDGRIPTRPASRPITIHDLLTHTAGIGYVFDDQTGLGRQYLDAGVYTGNGSLKERVERVAKLPLYDDPGEKWRYSYATDIAAYVIEVASGEPVEDYLRKNFFAPLAMNGTAFFVDETDFNRLAIVYAFDENGKMVRAKDETLFNDINKTGLGFASGGAGLASTLHDYLQFARMMLNGGALDGAQILSPASVRLMMSNALSPNEAMGEWSGHGVTFGLGGLVVDEPGMTGESAAPGEWGWSGYWDTWFRVNPADGVAVVVLAQTQPGPTTPPSRAVDRVKAIAYGAVLPAASAKK